MDTLDRPVVVVDGYNPDDVPAEVVKADKLAELARAGEFWWVEHSRRRQWSPRRRNWPAARTSP